MTPPRSGPNCISEPCITYPYTDAAEFVPTDYIWMYPAFLMGLLFVILIVCIHHYAADDKKTCSQIALSLAVISAASLMIGYFIQLTVMQPNFLKGETEGLSLFSQYNPHGVFIALEDFGYLMMGTSLMFASAVFVGRNKLERAIRFIFIACGVVAIGSLILLAILYGSDLEYRYEVVAIILDWLVLIVTGILLGIFFNRAGRGKVSRLPGNFDI
jgi:uncharacterized membrane protein